MIWATPLPAWPKPPHLVPYGVSTAPDSDPVLSPLRNPARDQPMVSSSSRSPVCPTQFETPGNGLTSSMRFRTLGTHGFITTLVLLACLTYLSSGYPPGLSRSSRHHAVDQGAVYSRSDRHLGKRFTRSGGTDNCTDFGRH